MPANKKEIVPSLIEAMEILRRVALMPDCAKFSNHNPEVIHAYMDDIARAILRYQKDTARVLHHRYLKDSKATVNVNSTRGAFNAVV